ncbi:hypothetical protein [Bradyrhizobium erythrophlei]|nr:hypothetical protein [Bradyrhizobium erythrophlei]
MPGSGCAATSAGNQGILVHFQKATSHAHQAQAGGFKMGQPTWRKIATVSVPENKTGLWTPALDYVTQGKLYKITVEMKPDPADETKQVPQTWKPESGRVCTADGDPTIARKDPLMMDSCAAGAMIGKVGGSSADTKADKDKLVLFVVGHHCVFCVSDAAKCGSLYLAVNDVPGSQGRVEGQIEVTIFEAL